jgi:hypothetical protein
LLWLASIIHLIYHKDISFGGILKVNRENIVGGDDYSKKKRKNRNRLLQAYELFKDIKSRSSSIDSNKCSYNTVGNIQVKDKLDKQHKRSPFHRFYDET